MTITVFVDPRSLDKLIEIMNDLKPLEELNDYTFDLKDLAVSTSKISSWLHVNMEITEFQKLKNCISRINLKQHGTSNKG